MGNRSENVAEFVFHVTFSSTRVDVYFYRGNQTELLAPFTLIDVHNEDRSHMLSNI